MSITVNQRNEMRKMALQALAANDDAQFDEAMKALTRLSLELNKLPPDFKPYAVPLGPFMDRMFPPK